MSLIKHYSSYNEGSRLISTKAKNIELTTTQKYIEKYLAKDSRILEIAAGEGIYSSYLAAKGNTILATDIVPNYVNTIAENNKQYPNLKTQVLDATKMTDIPASSYDFILALGPLYHIQTEEARQTFLQECKRIVTKNGIMFFAYINTNYAIPRYIKKGIKLQKADYQNLQNEKASKLKTKDLFAEFIHYTTPEKIEEEIQKSGLTLIEHIATDGVYGLIEENVETLTPQEYQALIEYHQATCTTKSILGTSSHGLLICKP